MGGNGGMAFARLLSQRRGELDLSVVDIAVRTGIPIEVVVGWDQGTAVPDGDEVSELAEILQLPEPLLGEALRRVADHRPDPDPADPSPPVSRDTDDPDAVVHTPHDTVIDPYPSPDFTERLRQVPDLALRALSRVSTDVQRSVGRRRRMARAPTAQPSYLEDRDQLITYRLRMVFTAAGIAVLALALRWSLGGLGSAVTDLWNAIVGAL